MTITYSMGNQLYVNITNRCPNACDFCVRDIKGAFEYDLWLEREPSVEETLTAIFSNSLDEYQQIVFCGFGEPLVRLCDVLRICKSIKEKTTTPIRVNTNGLGNLIYQKDITPGLKGLVDEVSISLNAGNAQDYQALCHSEFGLESFPALLDFARKCKAQGIQVQLTVVDFLPTQTIEICKSIAEEMGVRFKIRSEVG